MYAVTSTKLSKVISQILYQMTFGQQPGLQHNQQTVMKLHVEKNAQFSADIKATETYLAKPGSLIHISQRLSINLMKNANDT